MCIVTELKAACHFAGVCFSLVGSDGGKALPGCCLFSTWQQGFEWIFFGSRVSDEESILSILSRSGCRWVLATDWKVADV